MATLQEMIAQRLQPHIDAARAAYGTAWATAAQERNPAKDHPIRYENGELVVPLIPYVLSEGAAPHNIPYSFGYDRPGRPFYPRGKWGIPFGADGGDHPYGAFHPGIMHPSHFLTAARASTEVKAAMADFPYLIFRGAGP